MSRALRHPNYRLFFIGQAISLVGTWLTRVAMSWLVYRLTSSPILLGVVGFAGQLPTFLLAPFAGVLVDRWNRHRVLVATQVCALVQSAMLAAFALTNTITVWHVLLLSIFQGLINAFDTPARQAFVVEMVTAREDLPNAIALNSSMVHLARLIGPSIAGGLIAVVGEGWCFTIDAISYLAVIASLLMMKLVPRPRPATQAGMLASLGEGFRYVRSHAPIRSILLSMACVSLVGVPYMVLMPVFAARVFSGGPHTLGLLMGASGLGALAGALWLASRRSVLGLGRVICVAGGTFGAAMVGFGLSQWLWLSMLLMVLTGAGMMVQMSASNTLVQTLVDEDKRGRVMSFFTMAFFGMLPFGSLAAGLLGDRIGAQSTVVCCGVATLVAMTFFARKLPELRRLVRPTYVRLGILPEIAEGLSQTERMRELEDQ